MAIGVQILGFIISMIMLITVSISYHKKKIHRLDGVIWILICFAIIIFAIKPSIPLAVLDNLTVERVNAIMISGILILFVIVLRIHLRLEYTNRTLTLLVQQIAFDQFQKNTKKPFLQPSNPELGLDDIKDS